MMQRYIYKILFLLWGISSCGVLYSQVLINYGAKILANPGSHIHINGSIQNKSNGQLSINYNSGINAEMYVTGDVINDAILTCNGHIRLLGNWYNNSIFTSATGTVFF
ncbi:MAG TPA: hypothetical protein PLP11_11225, partial [Bacteroidales bacterium]|nr:hypothetical protein [Bacteroidales bacterium]